MEELLHAAQSGSRVRVVVQPGHRQCLNTAHVSENFGEGGEGAGGMVPY